jgi:hypothetical protein
MKTYKSISYPRHWWIAPLTLVEAFALLGCQRAPSFSIFGSFFPVWIFCVVIGVIVAVLFHALFVRITLDGELQPAVLIYPCIAVSSAATLWLLFFS